MTTFKGPLNVKGAINQKSVAAGTGAVTLTQIVDADGNLSVASSAHAVLPAEHGAGAIGTSSFGAPQTRRWTEDGVIITQIKFDITGFGVLGTAANEVIGLVAGGAAYIGRNVVATNGVVFKAELSCTEVPGQGTATIT